MYLALKTIHTICAVLTLCGFLLRGYWQLQKSPLLRHPVTRIAPHVVDTLFLASGIALIVEINLALKTKLTTILYQMLNRGQNKAQSGPEEDGGIPPPSEGLS